VGLTLYRTVQEALHNVRRHSTASAATVVLRVDASPRGGFAEVEVLDAGRPRTGTSGTGLGLLGMRERVASLDGSLEIGPRATGGFRVRVRLPLTRATATDELVDELADEPADEPVDEPVESARTPEPVESAR
jgi:signal transduction histidine kinase